MNDSIDFIYKLIKDYGFIKLSDCTGSCPCCSFYIRGITFEASCWRGGNEFEFSGITLKQHYDFNYSNEDLNKLGSLCVESIKEVWSSTDWEYKIIDKDE